MSDYSVIHSKIKAVLSAAQDGEKYSLLILLKGAHFFFVTCDDTDNTVFTAFFALEGSAMLKSNDP